MFNCLGNIEKIKYSYKLGLDKQSKLHLNKTQLRILENTNLIEIESKIEILEMIAGFRMMTELIIPKNKIKKIKTLLDDLNIIYLENRYTSKKDSTITEFISIFTNKTLFVYFKKFEKEIDSNELGLLYGYHPKSILAFLGIIEQRAYTKPLKPYQYYNQKVLSEDFFEEEDKYHLQKWTRIKKISPAIIKLTEKEFITAQQSDTTH